MTSGQYLEVQSQSLLAERKGVYHNVWFIVWSGPLEGPLKKMNLVQYHFNRDRKINGTRKHWTKLE